MNQPVFRPAYAGIGSRETPREVLRLMYDLAGVLALRGWILRTGGAPGADQAFFAGAMRQHLNYHCIETYLPWANFERERLALIDQGDRSHISRVEPAQWTFDIAAHYHPAWDRLKQGAQKLHARNVHQVMGFDQQQARSMFVCCWTPDGKASGGTGQALRIAEGFRVEIRNLHDPRTFDAARALVERERSAP